MYLACIVYNTWPSPQTSEIGVFALLANEESVLEALGSFS